ncbi:MAG: nuclear transport factor 2 family protein, partial [Pseudomonadota bacterium]
MTAKSVVEAMYAAYAQGDLEATFALLHPDVLHTAHATNARAKFCGTFNGVDAVRARISLINEHWTFEMYAPQTVIAEGQRVAAMVQMIAVERHTGQRIEMVVGHFFVVQDGKITELIEIFDSALVDAA